MRERIALAIGVLLIALSAVQVLSRREPRLASSNTEVGISVTASSVAPGSVLCENDVFVPADAVAMRVFAAAQSTGQSRLVVTVADRGRVVERVVAAAGARAAPLELPIGKRPHDLDFATVCFRNGGRSEVQLADAGAPGSLGSPKRPGVRIDFLRGGRESAWAIAPAVAARSGIMKSSLLGTWTLWAVAAAMLALGAVAVMVVLRSGRSRT